MAKRKFKQLRAETEKPLAGEPSDPRGMYAALAAFFQALKLKDYSPHSVNSHRQKINDFIRWCTERPAPSEVG